MKKVIDVRDMHTAIHSLYLVERKPKTTCKLFLSLSTFNKNVESLGEIDYRDLQGQKVWHNGILTSEVTYKSGESNYQVIGSYDIY